MCVCVRVCVGGAVAAAAGAAQTQPVCRGDREAGAAAAAAGVAAVCCGGDAVVVTHSQQFCVVFQCLCAALSAASGWR